MSGLPSWLLLAIFLGSAAVIWFAGVALSDTTDVLAERLHLGSALGGLIMLAIATNLPGIAITVSAALSHHLDIAVGNILGGVRRRRKFGLLQSLRERLPDWVSVLRTGVHTESLAK